MSDETNVTEGLEALTIRCGYCAATGWCDHPTDPQLEQECEWCDGRGTRTLYVIAELEVPRG